MHANQVTEAEVSRQTHIPQPTIHKILSGKTTDPRVSTLRALADFFKISIDELVTGIRTKRQAAETHSIPVISWSECIEAEKFIATLNPSTWSKWVVTEPLRETCFAVMSKPSMEPRFAIGSILVIDPGMEAVDGDIVLVHYVNTPEATLRKISIDGPLVLLANLYGDTSPQTMASDITIKGVLIRSIVSYQK
jgi:SOS-response transcriptional repressor LexA